MTAKENENQKDDSQRENGAASPEAVTVEESQSEMEEQKWSVVTFETCAASNLTYRQAVEKLKQLSAEKVAGLCVVTDEAASRIKN